MKRIIKMIGIGVALCAVSFFYNFVMEDGEFSKLSYDISKLKETHIPAKFKILNKSKDSIYFKIKFYDFSNNEIKVIQTKLFGSELSIDFDVYRVDDSTYISIPIRIFTERIAPDFGIQLDLDYGIPKTAKMVYGTVVHDYVYNQYDLGYVYSIVSHKKGGIEVQN